jgi:diaminopimelate epimerase
MRFWKMHGAGNDFIIVNNIDEKISEDKFSCIAAHLCRPHFSIGADGMMFVEKPEGDADVKMLYYNSDGSPGEMCGNGARCISRYCYENKLAGDTMKIETVAGLVSGQRIDKRNYKVRLNDPTHIKLNSEAKIGGKRIPYSYMELGNPGVPHMVVPIKNLKEKSKSELFELGRALRYYKDLSEGANVNFYDLVENDKIFERTWERGVEDFTAACGTGTGAAIGVLKLLGKVSGSHVEAEMDGGTLYVDIEIKEDKIHSIYLTGPTNIVAKGEVCDEDLKL